MAVVAALLKAWQPGRMAVRLPQKAGATWAQGLQIGLEHPLQVVERPRATSTVRCLPLELAWGVP